MSAATLPITASIGGRLVSRSEVLAWEARRASKVLRKLGLGGRPMDIAAQRDALVAAKLELGHAEIERRLSRELRWSERLTGAVSALSRGRRRVCSIELACEDGSAEGVPRWYLDAMESGDEAALLLGCPDHYVLRLRGDGLQEVVETTGGAPLATRILLDPSQVPDLRTAADPDFPVQWVAAGGIRPGATVGGLRHQFRDEPGGGFRARLTVELPATVPPHLIRAHRWHLACEFSNWIEACDAAGGSPKN